MSMTPERHNPVADHFGRLARSHRFHVGLTQEQLADRSGLSPRTIRHIESGRSLPRASTLRLLAGALELPPGDRAAFTDAAVPESASSNPAAEVSAQLPAGTTIFAGRQREMQTLLERADAGSIVVITGMAGIGKSSLAVHAARELSTRFPDGQLYLDLRGASATSAAVDPSEALDRLLRALEVPVARIPAHRDDRAAVLRTVLSERRVLLLLDNVADDGQLRPLLPGDSASMILVTGRHRLAGTHDTFHVELEPLDTDTAVSLLEQAAGKGPYDRHALVDIVERCGRLPLAIRIAAAKLRSRPQWTPADLLRRMLRPHHLLSALSVGDDSVSAAFDATYRGLPQRRQQLFRRLGTLPVADFDAFTAAARLNSAPDDIEDELESLVDAQLLMTDRPGRYHFHDLLREYAAVAARQTDDESEHTAGFGRVLNLFRSAATTATQQLAPQLLNEVPQVPPIEAVAIPGIHDHHDAVDWFEAERGNALALIDQAAKRGMDRESIALAAVVRPFLLYHSYLDELLIVAERAVATAQRLGDRHNEAYWLLAQGRAFHLHGQPGRSAQPQLRAMRLFEDLGDLPGQVAVGNALGLHAERQCQYESASGYFERAIQLARTAGTEAMEGVARTNCANLYRNLGRYEQAREHLHTAGPIFQRLGYDRELARTRFNLGNVLRTEGDAEAALELHERVAAYARAHDEPAGLGFAHNAIAMDCEQLGRITEAQTHCERAVEAAQRARQSDLHNDVLRTQGRIQLAWDHLDSAEETLRHALNQAKDSKNPRNAALAMHGIADVLAARGDTAAAQRQYAVALEIYESLGVPEAEALRRQLERHKPKSRSG